MDPRSCKHNVIYTDHKYNQSKQHGVNFTYCNQTTVPNTPQSIKEIYVP